MTLYHQVVRNRIWKINSIASSSKQSVEVAIELDMPADKVEELTVLSCLLL